MNKDIKLIWERFLYTEKDSIAAAAARGFSFPRSWKKFVEAADLIERIYVTYKPHEGQKENILDYFNEFGKPGSQDIIREILQKKMVSILRTDPGSEEARKLMNIMTIIGQPKGEGDLPPVF